MIEQFAYNSENVTVTVRNSFVENTVTYGHGTVWLVFHSYENCPILWVSAFISGQDPLKLNEILIHVKVAPFNTIPQ